MVSANADSLATTLSSLDCGYETNFVDLLFPCAEISGGGQEKEPPCYRFTNLGSRVNGKLIKSENSQYYR